MSFHRIRCLTAAVSLILSAVGVLAERMQRPNVTDDGALPNIDFETPVRGSSGSILYDILLQVQQHDQQQRLEMIEQRRDRGLQQREQHEMYQLLRQLQANITVEIGLLQRNESTEHERKERGSYPGSVLMQQHYGGTTFFNRTWNEFKAEFGASDGNYWIGNERLHFMTNDGHYKLRIDMLAKSDNQWYWAEYSTFRVFDETSSYTLNIGGYSGNAGDSMKYVNGRRFSTRDNDRDMWEFSCATTVDHGNGGGFWYDDCGHAFPNSPYEGSTGCAWGDLPVGSSWTDRKVVIFRMSLIPQ